VLLPQNRFVWNLYHTVIAPHIIRTEWQPAGNKIFVHHRLDLPALLDLINLYPVGNPRAFLSKVLAIFETLK
jgi:hypothetical protein